MTDSWQDAELVAVGIEGSGAQDGGQEDILEVAAVPLVRGVLRVAWGYSTVVNPGRRIPRRPSISPGLKNEVLATGPALSGVEPELAARLNGRILVGHHVDVAWRLLSLRCPTISPAGLIDTAALARQLPSAHKGVTLTGLVIRHGLASQIAALAPGGQPDRALWDAVASGLLLTTLLRELHGARPTTLGELRRLAGIPLPAPAPGPPTGRQAELFGGD